MVIYNSPPWAVSYTGAAEGWNRDSWLETVFCSQASRVAQFLNRKFPLGVEPGHSSTICRNCSPRLTDPAGEVSIWETAAAKYETLWHPWVCPCGDDCQSLFIRAAWLNFSVSSLFPSPGQGTVWLELFALTFFFSSQLCPTVSLSFQPSVTPLMDFFCGVSSLYKCCFYFIFFHLDTPP